MSKHRLIDFLEGESRDETPSTGVPFIDKNRLFRGGSILTVVGVNTKSFISSSLKFFSDKGKSVLVFSSTHNVNVVNSVKYVSDLVQVGTRPKHELKNTIENITLVPLNSIEVMLKTHKTTKPGVIFIDLRDLLTNTFESFWQDMIKFTRNANFDGVLVIFLMNPNLLGPKVIKDSSCIISTMRPGFPSMDERSLVKDFVCLKAYKGVSVEFGGDPMLGFINP
jgi:hypothetical protein